MKFYIKTLGCKINWLDSARVAAALQSAGHAPAAAEAEADVVFVNTCTVTAEAERKSRKEVNAAGRTAPRVAVMGCSPRVDGAPWAGRAANDDRLVFSDEQALYRHFGVDTGQLPFPMTSRTRLPVAIQMGCDNLCTFCITRVARGKHRNVPKEQVAEQVRQAEEFGIREVVLTGINLAAWGAENSNRAEQARLPELIDYLLAQTTIPRIRLSSLGPQYLHDGFFDVFADPRVCEHLHISLQSGSDRVLERMVRGHGTGEMLRVAERARAIRPQVGLAADLITGFPGEREADFLDTLALVERVGFSKLHVFPYSEREGTPAAEFEGGVEPTERKRRAGELRELGRRLRSAFIDSQVGRAHDVLVEAGGNGLTGNYLRVRMPGAAEGEIEMTVLERDRLAER